MSSPLAAVAGVIFLVTGSTVVGVILLIAALLAAIRLALGSYSDGRSQRGS